jgi:hypothetical protein
MCDLFTIDVLYHGEDGWIEKIFSFRKEILKWIMIKLQVRKCFVRFYTPRETIENERKEKKRVEKEIDLLL